MLIPESEEIPSYQALSDEFEETSDDGATEDGDVAFDGQPKHDHQIQMATGDTQLTLGTG